MDEFELIKRFFSVSGHSTEGVVMGVGDDAAVMDIAPGRQLVVTTDTMVPGVHFLEDIDPESLGHKLAAVNLSDIAAMGARPEWALLSLTLSEVNESWLQGFSDGVRCLLAEHGVALVGGDTTHGTLSAGMTVMGTVPSGQAITRTGATLGDQVCVSGTVGDAALALALKQGSVTWSPPDSGELLLRLNRPTPRVKLGTEIRGIATACIDISDGLAADAAHIAAGSSIGMELALDALPISAYYRDFLACGGDWSFATSGGDDYELCFTVPQSRLRDVLSISEAEGIPVAVIGTVVPGNRVNFIGADGRPYRPQSSGYRHFDGGDK